MKRIISIFLVGVVVLGLGLSKASAQTQTKSASVGLEGTVTATPPTTPARITLPSSGQTFTQMPITVSGICPTDLLVKLFKNGVFAGSVQCVNGSFSLSADLFNGSNDLIARVYDALDQAGPDSNTVTVTYNDVGFGSSRSRVTLTSNYAKRGANPNEDLTWPFTLSGGVAPYALSIDWGDGTTELLSRSAAGVFEIKHAYKTAGIYNLILKATDSNSATAFLQVVAIANGELSQDSVGSTDTSRTYIFFVWWPLPIAAILICISFWLGRRHKLRELTRAAEQRTTSSIL